MKPVNEQLQQEILAMSKKEFLAYGYNKATVRRIATAVGCTTGAIYRYYKGKMALFDALVREPAEALLVQYKKVALDILAASGEEALADVPDRSADACDWMVDYIYDYYDAFRLICCASEGTAYEHYIERLIEIEEASSNRFIESLRANNMLKREITPFMAHILASTFFMGIFEAVRHELSRDEAMAHMKTLQEFHLGGWVQILDMTP